MVNVGHFFMWELKEFKIHDGLFLMFSSLITKLCRQDRVKKFERDNWLEPSAPIFPLKRLGEGTVIKSKKI